ncbi:Six-hairpin glycosidase-like protein [Irpex lacteus]|nr:Six-hairpin glycosidase-like protein [Irpex lacteus]
MASLQTIYSSAHAADLPSELFSPLIAQKVLATANNTQNPPKYPQWTDRTNGSWQFFGPDTWTSGFFPATLYALNDRASICPSDELKETSWLELARKWSSAEVPLETKTTVGHDVGFLSFPFIEELKVNGTNDTAIVAVNNFASELAARFSPIVGCTRSWDTSDPTDFQVIIDNMMNLEVLFQSANLTGNHTLIDIATSHADKTLVNHLRPDGSSYHVVEYNSTTGDVIKQRTAQGYADNSTWSRGQAWGIYGFANMYQHTKNITYLETSRKMAGYFLDNLPEDGIVPCLLANGTVNNPAANNLTGSFMVRDYYFIKTTNDLVSLNITTCNGSLTGLTPSSPSSTLSPSNSSSSASNSTSASGSGSTDGVRTSGVLGRREVSGVMAAVVAVVVAAAMGLGI